MDVYEALYTTRAMRRVKTDPIPQEVQMRIMDAAVRAPSGGNSQNWRFMLVDDPDIKGQLGSVYRECFQTLLETHYKPALDAAKENPDTPESIEFTKMQKSALYLADHFEDYPLLLFGFAQHDPSGGSIFPSIWNAMLAARAEGVGSAITSVMMFKLKQMLEILKVPEDQGWNFAACVTMGYPTGRWGVAPRTPVHHVSYRNIWGEPLGFEINTPLWPSE
ncbi:MAG: nitroreductase family protein [bacterium]|nr:nitroreductase family protein [Gammaproteobacteria bacterium]HIL97198.1 nitroreductase family protein [Pseudomonadales bacterium]